MNPNLRFATPEPSIFFQQFDIDSKSFFFFRNPKAESQDARVTLAAGKRIRRFGIHGRVGWPKRPCTVPRMAA